MCPEEKVAALETALKECAVDTFHSDCCGVCKHHIVDCDKQMVLDDWPDGNESLACAGARARLLLRQTDIARRDAARADATRDTSLPVEIEIREIEDWYVKLFVNGYGVAQWDTRWFRNRDTTAKEYVAEVVRVLREALGSRGRRLYDEKRKRD